MSSELPQVTIFSDGACRGNPGPGGWAVILRFQGQEKELSGGERETTNNRMELTAALEGLRALKRPCRIQFYTDSQYLRRGINEWMPRWKARNWTRKGGELANVDLWQALSTAIEGHQIEWHWVQGHSGHPENERVDRLARMAVPKGSDL